MLQHCIPLMRSEECVHQFPAAHIWECLHCREGLTVQLGPWALNYSRQKRGEKRITRKCRKCTQKFFHPLEAFPDWPSLWKGNQVKHGKRDAGVFYSHSWIHKCDLEFWSSLSSPVPLLFSVHTDLSTPLYFVLAGLDRFNFCGTGQ